MKTEELLAGIKGDLDQVEALYKSYTMKKAEDMPISPAETAPAAPMAPEAMDSTPGVDFANMDEKQIINLIEQALEMLESKTGNQETTEPAMEQPPMEGQAPAAPIAPEAPMAQSEETPELPMGEEGGSEAPAAEGEVAPTDEGQGELSQEVQGGELEGEIANLSDEDFAKLQACVSAEAGKRGQQGPGDEVIGDQADKTVPAPIMDSAKPMQKALKLPKDGKSEPANGGKPEASSLMKSLTSLTNRLEQLEKAMTAPASTYADSSNIRVLEKSVEDGEPMTGFELASWLYNEQRKGNKLVKSMHIARANVAKDDALSGLYNELNSLGIHPKK